MMSEEQAIKQIETYQKKAFTATTGKAKPIFLEVDYIFQDNLIEFRKLLNISKNKNGKLYQKYKEIMILKGVALKYSGIKGMEFTNEERPPITISTFSMENMEEKLESFNNKIKEFNDESKRI